MSTSTGSAPTSVTIIPYAKQYKEYPAPLDDWGYYEGLPTPPLSPLMPYNTVPWFYRPWMFDKIKEPKYSFALHQNMSNRIELPNTSNIISKTIINDPTPVTDYHLIAIRKQIEQLFAPFLRAYIILRIQDTINYPPMFSLEHNKFQRSWWIGASGGMDDGIGSVESGHTHSFRDAPPTGFLRMKQELTIAKQDRESSDGSIRGIIGTPRKDANGVLRYAPSEADFRSSYGNYYLLSVEPRWTVTEHWRKVYLEKWRDIQNDYASTTLAFQMIVFGTWTEILRANSGFSPVGYAQKYCLDYGAMWEHENNVVLVEDGNGYPKTVYYPDQGKWGLANGPIYSACTRPSREFGKGFGGGSQNVAAAVTKEAIGFKGWYKVWGFTCGIFSKELNEVSPPEKPDFPAIIERPHAENGVIYNYSTDTKKFPAGAGSMNITYEAVGEEIEITPSEKISDADEYGNTYVAHCLGATVTPYWRVTIMSFNGLKYTMDIRECEVYYT